MRLIIFSFVFAISCSSKAQPDMADSEVETRSKAISVTDKYLDLFSNNMSAVSDGFDFPVGKPNAGGYYNAQGFGGKKHHLGDDWNGNAGGNNDLGDPIYASANGVVTEAIDKKGGWGQVVRVVHYHKGKFYESLYAHCNEMFVTAGDFVKRGQKIATIGNNGGRYLAHLHFEIRSKPDMPLGGGYSVDSEGYLDPTSFIKSNRPTK